MQTKRARIIRNILAAVSFVFALVFAASANFGIFVKRELYNTSAFERHTANLIANPDVQESLANEIANQIVLQVPQLKAFSGVVTTAVGAVVGTDQFRELFDESLTSAQEQLVAGSDVITLNLGAAAEPVLREITQDIPFASVILDNVLPAIQGILTVTVLTRDQAPELWTWVERGDQAGTWSIVLTLVFLALGIVLITRHWLGVACAGGVVVLAAIGSFISGWGSKTALRPQFSPGLGQRTFEAVYDEFSSAYTAQTFVLLTLGIVVLVGGLVGELVAVQLRHRRTTGGSEATPAPAPASASSAAASASTTAATVGASAPPTGAASDAAVSPPDASGPRPGPPLLDE